MSKKLYMVIENFKNKDAAPIYRRFRDRGRMAPDGLAYISSWVDCGLERCFQLMETHDRALLDQWMANWSDLVDFEVHQVMTSRDAAEAINPRLQWIPSRQWQFTASPRPVEPVCGCDTHRIRRWRLEIGFVHR